MVRYIIADAEEKLAVTFVDSRGNYDLAVNRQWYETLKDERGRNEWFSKTGAEDALERIRHMSANAADALHVAEVQIQ